MIEAVLIAVVILAVVVALVRDRGEEQTAVMESKRRRTTEDR